MARVNKQGGQTAKTEERKRPTVGFSLATSSAGAGNGNGNRGTMPSSMSMQEIGNHKHELLSALKRPSVISWLDNSSFEITLLRNDFANSWGFRMKRVDNLFTVVSVSSSGPAARQLIKGDKILAINGSDATLIADADAEQILKFSGLQLQLRVLRDVHAMERKTASWLSKVSASFKLFK